MKKKSFIKSNLIRILIPFLILLFFCYLIVILTDSISTAVFQIISLLFGVYLVKRGLNEPYMFNPYLFFSICPLTLAVYFPKVSEYYLIKIEDLTYIYILLNMILFYLGLEFFKNKRIVLEKSRIEKEKWKDKDDIDKNILAIIAIIISILGFIPVSYTLLKNSFSNWNEMKSILASFPFYPLWAYLPYIAVYLSVRSRKKISIMIVVVLALIAMLVGLTKTTVMFFIITLISSLEKEFNNKNTKNLFIITLIALISFSFLDNTYNKIRNAVQYEEIWVERSSGILTSSQLKTYLYFETPWSNVQYTLKNLKSHSYGLWSIRPVLILLRINDKFNTVYSYLQPFTTFNALGYITYLYSDFGIIGSLVMIFLLACFVSYIYEMDKTKNNPFLGIINVFTLRAVLMMFFNLHFFTEIYVLIAYILMNVINYFYTINKKTYSDF